MEEMITRVCPKCGDYAEQMWKENYPKGSNEYHSVYHCWYCDYDFRVVTEETDSEIKELEVVQFFFG